MCQAHRGGSVMLQGQLGQLVAVPVFVSRDELPGPPLNAIVQPRGEGYDCTCRRWHRPAFETCCLPLNLTTCWTVEHSPRRAASTITTATHGENRYAGTSMRRPRPDPETSLAQGGTDSWVAGRTKLA